MNITIVKITLAVLLFLCLLNMPYGYFQLVRFLALTGFAYLAYQAREEEKNTVFIIYCILALLFQPFLKVALGRELWNIIDVIVGIGLIISLFIKPKREETKNVKHHSDKL